MGSIELVVVDVVAPALQLWDDTPTAQIDRKDLIMRAMGDVDVGCSMSLAWYYESWRERDDLAKHVPVDQAKREGIGGSIGEASDCQMGRVHRVVAEGIGQCLVNTGNIWPIA